MGDVLAEWKQSRAQQCRQELGTVVGPSLILVGKPAIFICGGEYNFSMLRWRHELFLPPTLTVGSWLQEEKGIK